MSEHLDPYHDVIDPISKSQLAIFHDDPELFEQIFVARSMPRPEVGKAGVIGKVVHAWLLEERELSSMLVRIPADCLKSDGAINRKRLDAFMGASELIPVKDAEYEEIADALAYWSGPLRDLFRRDELGYQAEGTFTGKPADIRTKCRPDVHVLRDSGPVLFDIKASANIDDRSFNRSAREFRYWLQDAHYTNTIAEPLRINPLDVPFYFVTLETRFPYRVHVREYDEPSRIRANDEWAALLDAYAHARETGVYEHRRSRFVTVRDWELPLTSDQLVEWSEAA